MRVELLSLTGQPGPVSSCHFECATTTVLVGRNDSGKSFLLEGIDAALRDDPSWHFSASLEIFVRADGSELHDREVIHRVGRDDVDEQWLREAHVLPPDDLQGDVRRRLAVSGASEDGDLAVMTAPVEGLPLQIWACAAPWERLPEDLRRQLREARPEGEQLARERPWRPLPLALSRALRLLASRTDGHVDLRYFTDPDLAEQQPPAWAHDEHPEWADSTRWLLEEGPDSTSVNSCASFACDVFASLAQEILPQFITDRYDLHLMPRSVTEIARGETVSVNLHDRVIELAFPLARAATGIRSGSI